VATRIARAAARFLSQGHLLSRTAIQGQPLVALPAGQALAEFGLGRPGRTVHAYPHAGNTACEHPAADQDTRAWPGEIELDGRDVVEAAAREHFGKLRRYPPDRPDQPLRQVERVRAVLEQGARGGVIGVALPVHRLAEPRMELCVVLIQLGKPGLADQPACQVRAKLLQRRAVAERIPDRRRDAGAFLRHHQFLRHLGGVGDRLFAEHRYPGRQGRKHERRMHVIGRRDGHRIREARRQQILR